MLSLARLIELILCFADYESFRVFHPVNTHDYVFLGDYFQSRKTTGEDKPDMKSEELTSLRAV
jgi:hypothetical protein